jgi:hypothetical protein
LRWRARLQNLHRRQWGVVWDRPDDPIVQHFTPRNSWGLRARGSLCALPHAWRARFINADNGYTDDERTVYDDGYDAGNATLFEAIEFPGVTDPDLIWRHGRFHIAQARLRPEQIVINADWEQLVCTRGDRVRLTHDAMLIGLASGRVKAIAGQVVTLDELVTIEDGKTYAVRFRHPDDAIGSFTRSVDVVATGTGETRQLTLSGESLECRGRHPLRVRRNRSRLGGLSRQGDRASAGPRRALDAGRRRAGHRVGRHRHDPGLYAEHHDPARSVRRCRRRICSIRRSSTASAPACARWCICAWTLPRRRQGLRFRGAVSR